jgi:soluble lytic murein transglycosylase-like protein
LNTCFLNQIGSLPLQNMCRVLSNLKRSALLCVTVLVGMLAWHTPAQADVWGYIDAKGVAHFASEKVDDRYELFFKGGTGFDTRDGVNTPAKPEAEPPRQVAVPAGKSKLLAYFDVSPNFKAVKHHMRESAQAYNLDFELLQALIATESGFDANAVSPKGAVGLMQLMPPTAQRYGVRGDAKTPIEKKLTDPKTNIRAGSRYLRDLINMFPGKLELALAAYNAGEGAVQRYGNKIPPFKETQNYVVTVMQIYNQLKPPAAIAQRQQEARQPGRVRMEFPNSPAQAAPGQIAGRGNMVPPLSGSMTGSMAGSAGVSPSLMPAQPPSPSLNDSK